MGCCMCLVHLLKSFPRIVWDSIIDNDQEWERFAQASGTTYPEPQYSPGSVVVSPQNDNVGVVLVGDACHAVCILKKSLCFLKTLFTSITITNK